MILVSRTIYTHPLLSFVWGDRARIWGSFMETNKKFFHDRVVLLLATAMAILVTVGVLSVLIRFDVSKNPTIVVAWRTNISGSSYQSGKPIDLYSLAIFMVITAAAAIFLGNKMYALRRSMSLFILASADLLLILSVIVANALISLL